MTDHSRADLLRFKKAGINPDQLATSVWFERLAVPETDQILTKQPIDLSSVFEKGVSEVEVAEDDIQPDDSPRPPECFWVVTEKSTQDIPKLSGPEVPEDLIDLINTPPLTDEDSEGDKIYAATTRPDKKPLLAWQRLWPVLQGALSKSINNQKTDTDKLVKQVSRGQWPNKIPVKTKQHLSAQSLVLVHIPDYLHPLRRDIHDLLDKLEKQIGGQGSTLQYIQNHPGGTVSERVNQKKQRGPVDSNWKSKSWRLPEKGTPILIISDLGLYSRTPHLVKDWLKLGRQLKTAGFSPTVLVPLPEILIPKEFTSLYQCLSWDQGSTLNPAKGRFNLDQIQAKLTNLRHGLGCNFTEKESQDKADNVGQPVKSFLSCDEACLEDKARKEYLIWLSAAVEVDENDLRAVRLGLGKPLSVADEVLIWQSNLIEKSSNLCAFPPQIHRLLRNQLQHQVKQLPKQAVKVFTALKATLKTQLATDYYEAILFFKDLPHLTPDDQQLLDQAEKYINSFIQALDVPETGGRHREYRGIHDYSEQILSRLDENTRKDRRYSYWWSQWYKNRSDSENTFIPSWVDKSVFQAVNSQGLHQYDIAIGIQGNELILSVDGAYQSLLPQGLDSVWNQILNFSTDYNQVTYVLAGKQSRIQSKTLSSEAYITLPLSRFSDKAIHLQIGDQTIQLSAIQKPSWAASVQRISSKLSASVYLNGQQYRVKYSSRYNLDELLEAFDKSIQSRSLDDYLSTDKSCWSFAHNVNTEDFVQDIAEDQYGLYADLNFLGITQRFRWIEPGTFLMGTPDDEPERRDNETQHSVTLTQGYWLADTCVTQELWQVVMGQNPSEFKGEQNPVDNVSWQDCWQFILKLKEKYPSLRLTLPSEAQWEYACRAGTTTPFSFGDQINSEQVNFRGTAPYNEGEESKFRERTVPVKSLPVNPWGLYEMHGNLWEWCQDHSLREYQSDKSIADPGQQWLENPEGEEDAMCPLRGGGWIVLGQHCRSAERSGYQADFRNVDAGFRLSLGAEFKQGGRANVFNRAKSIESGIRNIYDYRYAPFNFKE